MSLAATLFVQIREHEKGQKVGRTCKWLLHMKRDDRATRQSSHPCWPSDNTLILRMNRQSAFEFLFLQLREIDFASLNRGSTQPLLTQTDLKSQRLLLAVPAMLDHFSCVAGSMYRRIDKAEHESRTLAVLRDALLPKLISGELRVKDAEKCLG